MPYHNDHNDKDWHTLDKDAGRLFNKIYLPLTLFVRVQKGYSRVVCERELGTEHNWNILTPKLWPSALWLSRSPGLLTGGPGPTLLVDGFSLLHLISIFSGPQFIRAPSPFGLVWLSLPHLVSLRLQLSATQLAGTRTQLSYIIVRRLHDLWNWMFNRHQAEITVMQFQRSLSSGASLCDGTVGPSPCPILSALIRPRDLLRLLAIGMCHVLPVHHLGMACLGRVEGQNITGCEVSVATKNKLICIFFEKSKEEALVE